MSLKDLFPRHKSGGRTIESRDLLDEYLAKDLTRRHLLQGALAAVSLAACGTGATPGAMTPADAGVDAGKVDVDAAPDVPVAAPPMRVRHLVGIGEHEDHVMAAEAALAETHDFDFVQAGQRVYLKVNTNSGDPFPYSTSPDMIRWVVGKIRERGGEAFIGDRSFYGDRGTMTNFRANGIADVASELGVDLLVFGDSAAGDSAAHTVDWMDLPPTIDGVGDRAALWSGTMRIPAPVATADHIVAMPCMKTHFIATFTMSMKNAIGLVNPVDRARSANLGSHSTVGDRLFRQVAFMNKAGPAVSLVVLDGHQALLSGGPTPTDRPPAAPSSFTRGVTGAPHLVVISRDRVAADLTGVSVLKTLSPMYERIQSTSAWSNRQIVQARNAGFGLTDHALYDLSGPTVTDLARIRELALAE